MSYPEIGFVLCNGVTGGGIALATGAALSAKTLGLNRVALSFFGDGATSQGTFHESLNLAKLWNLPVVFFLENNLYGQWTHISRAAAGHANLWQRAHPYGITATCIDGMDVLEVRTAVAEAAARARDDGEPTLIEARTYRFGGHSKSDVNTRIYRPADEEEHWRQRDPIVSLRRHLLLEGLESEETLTSIDEEVARQIEEIAETVQQDPVPDRIETEMYAP